MSKTDAGAVTKYRTQVSELLTYLLDPRSRTWSSTTLNNTKHVHDSHPKAPQLTVQYTRASGLPQSQRERLHLSDDQTQAATSDVISSAPRNEPRPRHLVTSPRFLRAPRAAPCAGAASSRKGSPLRLRGQRGHLGQDLELVRHGERLLALLERECLAHGTVEGGGGARLLGVRVRVLG